VVTVQNDRIRVTVTQEIWDSYAERAESITASKLGDCSVALSEQVQRGLVLSEAMSKLGNASEVALLENESVLAEEIETLAREHLMLLYLQTNRPKTADKTAGRYRKGLPLTYSMKCDVALGLAFAEGALSPVTAILARKELIAYVTECEASNLQQSPRELAHLSSIMGLRMGIHKFPQNVGVVALADAAHIANNKRLNELQYRRGRADMRGWQIEVIGVMPTPIGVCRYAPANPD
jgi:hypothetical protein